jgi:hypothetical protein
MNYESLMLRLLQKNLPKAMLDALGTLLLAHDIFSKSS